METDHPKKIGEYDILGVIGKGAMGKVYKAAKPPQNTIVALKVLPAEFMEDEDRVERFNREAQAVALLKHRNVVRIVERGEDEGRHYFVMEYVPGTSLDSVLRQRRLSLPEAIRVFSCVCKGLQAAHQQSIVHRDLSPRNILVSEDLSTVKIADFGISRIESVSQAQGTLSTTEFSLGSLHYIAPEQARNMATADHRADIYSLGVLLYEMLTGRVPVGRFNLPSQLNSEVPPEVDPIVLRCLEVKPEKRYPSVARLLKEVRRLEDQLRLGLVHEVRGIGSQTSKIFLRSGVASRTARVALIVTGAAALLGGGYFAIRSGQNPPAPSAPVGDPVQIVQHSRSEVSKPTSDPLAAALDALEAPAEENIEHLAGEAGPLADSRSGPGVNSESAPAPARTRTTSAVAATGTPAKLATDLEVARKKLGAGLLDEAQQDVEGLIAGFPKNPAAAEAYLLLGKIHEEKKESDKARATYIELQSRFGDSEAAVESVYRSAKLLQSEGGREDLQMARGLLADLVEGHPRSPWAPQALLDKAAIETAGKKTVQDASLGARVPAALATYRSLVNNYPGHPGAETALWKLGEMYEELKKFDSAVEIFETLGHQFPATKHDVWWSAGQIYDRRLDDDTKAVAAYRKVPSDSRHHSDAKRRIGKLTK